MYEQKKLNDIHRASRIGVPNPVTEHKTFMESAYANMFN